MDVKATSKLPKHRRTLRDKVAEWTTKETSQRDHLVISSVVAFVRHHYTNYNDLLAVLPEIDTTADEVEIMAQYQKHQQVYQNLKCKATALAERMLIDAYGEIP